MFIHTRKDMRCPCRLFGILYAYAVYTVIILYLQEAKEMFEAALNITTKIYAQKTIKSLNISYEHANLIFLKGSFDESRSVHTSIMQQRLQTCDELHPDKSDSLFMLGVVAVTTCKYDDGGQILAESLHIRRKVFGDSHWKVGEIYKVLAEILTGKGLFEESNAFYDKALSLFRNSLGDQHHLIANVFTGQAINMIETGQFENAMSIIEQGIIIRIL